MRLYPKGVKIDETDYIKLFLNQNIKSANVATKCTFAIINAAGEETNETSFTYTFNGVWGYPVSFRRDVVF